MIPIHFRHQQIDKSKWDSTILNAKNGLIYAESWFLDIVSPGWEALIAGDYEFIMPLPVKKKLGIGYLVQPTLTQQLGLFSKNEISALIVEQFIRAIPYFSYEMHLNEANYFENSQERINLTLSLSKSYTEIQTGFSNNCRRNIKKSISNNLKIRENLILDEFLQFYTESETNYSKHDIELSRKLLKAAEIEKKLIILGVENKLGKLIAAQCLFVNGKRLINLLPISNDEGKRLSAMFFLINFIIETHVGKDYLLDFEGSMIEGIARFYKGFGAEEHNYGLIKRFRPKLLIGRI